GERGQSVPVDHGEGGGGEIGVGQRARAGHGLTAYKIRAYWCRRTTYTYEGTGHAAAHHRAPADTDHDRRGRDARPRPRPARPSAVPPLRRLPRLHPASALDRRPPGRDRGRRNPRGGRLPFLRRVPAQVRGRLAAGSDRRPRSPPLSRIRGGDLRSRRARPARVARHRPRGRARGRRHRALAPARASAAPGRRLARAARRFPHRSRRPGRRGETRRPRRRPVVGRRTVVLRGPHDQRRAPMMSIELFVGSLTTPDDARAMAERILAAFTTGDSAPEGVLAKARELTHVLVHRPAAWVTGGPAGQPRYLVRITMPAAWHDPGFAGYVVPAVTAAIAGVGPDSGRLEREPHCVVQIVGVREHGLGLFGRPVSSTEVVRVMTQDF